MGNAMKDTKKQKEVKQLLKIYKKALLHHEISGEYRLEELSRQSLHVKDEAGLMRKLDVAFEILKNYPDNGNLYYKLISEAYIQDETMGIEQIAEKNNMTYQKTWRYIDEAVEVISMVVGEKL